MFCFRRWWPVGILLLNHKPEIFMGDIGSLALVLHLPVSVLVHHEFSLLIVSIIYVCEI